MSRCRMWMVSHPDELSLTARFADGSRAQFSSNSRFQKEADIIARNVRLYEPIDVKAV